MPDRVALINLGCPKNLVDSEVMLGHLRSRGFELTTDPLAADAVVVNTCGFLADSTRESVETLEQLAALKGRGRLRAVVAAGCMVQRFRDDVEAELPGVDGFLGVGQAADLADVVAGVLDGRRICRLNGPAAGFEGYGLRLPSTDGWTAYVKASEGCDRHCSFCVIPSIRGPMVSRPPDQIEREARRLVASGTRELILIGQDPTRYGVDRGGHGLPDLLRRLSGIEDLRWLRVMYVFPDRHTPPILDAVVSLPRLCRYVDMPFQHASPEVLRRMNRPGDAGQFLELISGLRGACPDVSVRSTFITGFPGETEADFERLERFVEAAELDWVGVFCYSREDGSPAAALRGQVPRRISRARRARLMELQQAITARRLQRWVGRQVEVLVERVDGETGRGRTAGQAPEIDGEARVDLSTLPGTRPGDFVLAEISAVDTYDLSGRAKRLLHRSPLRSHDLIQIDPLPEPALARP